MVASDIYCRINLTSIGTVALIATPFLSYDPTNVGRFLFLSTFGSILLLALFFNSKGLVRTGHRNLLLLGLFFCVWALIANSFSKSNLTESIFGVTGRQTGLISYFGLLSILVFSSLLSSENFTKKAVCLLLCVGVLDAAYGFIQYLRIDPFDWINPYSPVFGILGNPNFHSSFMGMVAGISVIYLVECSRSPIARLGSFILFSISLLNIHGSKSQQGYLVLGVALSTYLILKVYILKKNSSSRFLFIGIYFIGFVVVALDILQRMPWQSKLYEESISFRGDFWRAGWAMILDNPFFGVGFDGYRDQYRLYRDYVAASRNQAENYVDSAHNVFLDIGVNGGFPLMLSYIFVITSALVAIFRLIRSNRMTKGILLISPIWVAYLAQSLISINHLGLAIWGWALTGLIIGYEINTRGEQKSKIEFKSGKSLVIPIIFGTIIGGTIGGSQFVSDAKFRLSMKSGDISKIESALDQWPKSVTRMVITAGIFRENKIYDQAADISEKAVEFNPSNYEAWKELSLQPAIAENLRKKAQEKMKELNSPTPIIE